MTEDTGTYQAPEEEKPEEVADVQSAPKEEAPSIEEAPPADPTPEEEVDLDTVELMPIGEVLEGLMIAVGAQATEVDADKYGLVLRNLDAALITFNSIK
jgi:hypothetical protein